MLCTHFFKWGYGHHEHARVFGDDFHSMWKTPMVQWGRVWGFSIPMELIVKDLIGNESINSWSQYEKYSHAFALLPPSMSCPSVAYLILTGSENIRRRKTGTRFEFNLEHRIIFIPWKRIDGNKKIIHFIRNHQKLLRAPPILAKVTRYTFLRSASRNNVPMKNLRIFTPFMFLVLPSTI